MAGTNDIRPQDLQARIGEVLGTSEWLTVDQERIDRFAKATDDFQFIHVDPDKARQTPFGGTIAHGFLLLSLFPTLLERSDTPRIAGARMALNYGGNRVRFLPPVRSGTRIRGRFRLLALDQKRPGQWQQTMEITVEIESESPGESEERPALIAEWITQVFV